VAFRIGTGDLADADSVDLVSHVYRQLSYRGNTMPCSGAFAAAGDGSLLREGTSDGVS
jgi:hypothetical protein